MRVTLPEASAPGLYYSKLLLTIPASDVELWWPIGYGAQPLYDMNVRAEQ